jgi:release factor glutamine methyltransferase
LQADAKVWTIGALVKWATDDFRMRGIESPRLDAELIVAHALGITRTQVIIDMMRPLGDAELATLRALVKRRRAHEPIAYLRGEREFYGRVFRVDKRALVPRPETEVLVDVALARTRHVSMSTRLLDLCTGTGCVAITIARQRPTSKVLATDLSPDALALARENAHRLGAMNVAFVEGDLFEAVTSLTANPRVRRWGGPPFDLVTANPPYIPSGEIPGLQIDVRAFEPHLALDGGEDGLALVRRIVDEAPAFLAPGGVLAMEIGAGQAPDVAALLEARGFADVQVAKDLARIERVVSGVHGGLLR